MRKIILAISVFVLGTSMVNAQGGRDILKKMYERYNGKWYKTFSFNQTTEMYRNDSLIRTEIWYENIKFPGDFRIDFGSLDSGNAVIFKNDSSYLFRKGKLAGVRPDENDLVFLLGGMYFYPYDSVLAKMKTLGYNLDKFHEDTWKGNGVYIIGAGKGEDSVSQLWFDKEKLNLVRMIKFENNRKEEGLFENHVKLGGGYSESLVYFYINDKLIQVEKYHDLKADVNIDKSIFNAGNFVKLKAGSW
ncbi:MAG TPA: hypothetical protein VGP55_06985 [Chitinophagaceae bacterium]|nr:hypothetical protein [Chitinophagaceae bacterium]